LAHPAKWIEATPDEAVTAVAARSLKLRLKPVQQYLPLAAHQADEDVEHVHQLRVWSRRAQAAIVMYRDLLPEWRAAWIDAQLKRIRKATNDARDDDVFAERLAADKQDPGAARLLKRVREHRCESQRQVIAVYDRLKKDDRFDKRVAKLVKRVRLRGKEQKNGDIPQFGEWAAGQFRPVLEAFYESAKGDLADVDAQHQFRIAGKQVRYAMELLSGAFPPRLQDDVNPLLATLQDKLGDVNDHATALTRISGWIEDDRSAKESSYLQRILEDEQRRLEQSQNEFFAWWTSERMDEFCAAFEQALAIPCTCRGGAGQAKTGC
jgi:CHAD domain-containing protein